MDAVVTAGGIPQPDEALYSYSKGESKALIDVAGKPMIQWVLDALGEAQTIDRVVLIGLTDKSDLTCKKPLTYISNQGKMLDNLKAGTAKVLELNPKAKYVLFVSSDIPGIKAEMVDWVVNTCLETKDDLYYNVIRREDMETTLPHLQTDLYASQGYASLRRRYEHGACCHCQSELRVLEQADRGPQEPCLRRLP